MLLSNTTTSMATSVSFQREGVAVPIFLHHTNTITLLPSMRTWASELCSMVCVVECLVVHYGVVP